MCFQASPPEVLPFRNDTPLVTGIIHVPYQDFSFVSCLKTHTNPANPFLLGIWVVSSSSELLRFLHISICFSVRLCRTHRTCVCWSPRHISPGFLWASAGVRLSHCSHGFANTFVKITDQIYFHANCLFHRLVGFYGGSFC